jgi:hypothetical protein
MTTRLSRHFSGRLLGLVTVAVVAVAGCSGSGVKKITVKGTVTYKGAPLHTGLLTFSGPEGAVSRARINSDGTYIMTDVVPGETKIGLMETPQGSRSGTPKDQATPPIVFEKYGDPEKSGKHYTITPDTKELAIELD